MLTAPLEDLGRAPRALVKNTRFSLLIVPARRAPRVNPTLALRHE